MPAARCSDGGGGIVNPWVVLDNPASNTDFRPNPLSYKTNQADQAAVAACRPSHHPAADLADAPRNTALHYGELYECIATRLTGIEPELAVFECDESYFDRARKGNAGAGATNTANDPARVIGAAVMVGLSDCSYSPAVGNTRNGSGRAFPLLVNCSMRRAIRPLA